MATVSTIERTVARNTSTLALSTRQDAGQWRRREKGRSCGLERSLRDLRGEISRSAADFSRRKSGVRPRSGSSGARRDLTRAVDADGEVRRRAETRPAASAHGRKTRTVCARGARRRTLLAGSAGCWSHTDCRSVERREPPPSRPARRRPDRRSRATATERDASGHSFLPIERSW